MAVSRSPSYQSPLENHTKKEVIFSTGYCPSGLPHLGTFGEVLCTSMFQHAFRDISTIPSKIVCVSDDLGGLRKVPGNEPNRDRLTLS